MRKMTILSAAVILTILGYWLFKDNNSEHVNYQHNSEKALNKSQVIKPKIEKKAAIIEDQDVTDNENSEALSADSVREINDWLLKQGHNELYDISDPFNQQQTISSDYETYDNETLKALATNDSKAALVLGLRLQENGQLEEAEPYIREAAIHGYAKALHQMHEMQLIRAEELDKNRDTIKADAAYIESAAWYQIINLRFKSGSEDLSASNIEIYVDKERYEAIKQQALLRAKEIYEQLKEQRKRVGLGEFDNDIPESVRRVL